MSTSVNNKTRKKKKCATGSKTESHTPHSTFPVFFFEMFGPAVAQVDGKFVPGEHILDMAIMLQAYAKTAFVAPRYHIKTTIMLGYIAWKLYRLEHEYNEWLFIGYRRDLAAYHLKKLKRYIRAIPEFIPYEDMTSADSILHFKYKGREFVCEPEGILTSNRGRHPNGMIVDDILKDPDNLMDISQLKKIQTLFLEEFEQMPKEECHVVGTPQDKNDIFAKLETMDEYYSMRWKAVYSWKEGKVLWPEMYSIEYMQQKRRDIGDKAFNKEYQCAPVRGEEMYFTDTEIDYIIYPRLRNRSIYEQPHLHEYTYGGLDIGKKRHPSHLSLFGRDRHGRLVQLLSKWLDNTDYTDQLQICQELCKNYRVFRLYYDDTRAEFEGFKESGELPAQMSGFVFTNKRKHEIAAGFGKAVKQNKVMLIDDPRQARQILNCDNNLKSVETNEGHGDSFWSNALAIEASRDTGEKITFI